MRKMLTLLLTVGWLASLLSSCDPATGDLDLTSGTQILRVVPSGLAQDDGTYADDLPYDVNAIVEISPPVDGKSIHVSDADGFFRFTQIEAGTYQVSVPFTDGSLDRSVTFSADGTADSDPIVFPSDHGLYYYVVNASGNDSANGELNQDVRVAIGKILDRDALITASGAEGRTPALNLIPSLFSYSGMEEVNSIAPESADWADGNLSAPEPIDFTLLHNENYNHDMIGQEFKSQVEGLNAIGTVSLISQPWSDYLDNRNTLDFEMARAGWNLDSNNILVYLEALIDHCGLSDSLIDSLISQAQSELDSGNLVSHAATLVELHDVILSTGAVIPLYSY